MLWVDDGAGGFAYKLLVESLLGLELLYYLLAQFYFQRRILLLVFLLVLMDGLFHHLVFLTFHIRV